jgi:hypothetical protein
VARLEWQIVPRLTAADRQIEVRFGPERVVWEQNSARALRRVDWRLGSYDQISIARSTGRNQFGAATVWSGPWAPLFFFREAKNGKWNSNEYEFDVTLADGTTVGFRATLQPETRRIIFDSALQDVPPCPDRWTRAK